MIGILKAIGATNGSIQKIFIYTACYLAALGLILGNGVGLSLLFIQKYLSPIKLNPSIYYVTKAPVDINFWTVLSLNIISFVICMLILVIPSYIIGKISPVKAIKFDS